MVSLTVTDNNNCSATQNVPVSVSQPTLSTTVPGTVCPGKTFTISFSTNQASASWALVNNFTVVPSGGGVTSFTHQYQTPGTYTISTTVGNPPCAVTQTKVVVVELVTASITVANAYSTCANPLVATYSNASSPNAISYTWTSQGCPPSPVTYSSTLANPTFSFTQGSINPYTIYQLCVPSVNLFVMSANGCTASAAISTYSIQRPTAWFLKDKKEGCAPLVVTLRDSSFAYPTPSVITSYTWNNGASPPTIVTGVAPPIPNVTFTYNSPGTYTPFLTIQTAQGCTDVSFIDTVKVVGTPTLSFTFSPNVVCATTPVTVTNTSPTSPIQHFHWLSDAGFFSSCVSDPNPTWQFTHIGTHSFTMQAWQNSCPGTTTVPQTLLVRGPIVQSRFQTSCTNRKTVFFRTELQDAGNGSINFGDGTPTVAITGVVGAIAQHTINHTYANTGDYTVTVIGANGSGTCSPYTYTMLVLVRDVQADIALSPTACINGPTVFSAATSTDVLVTCSTGYTWFFDNNPPGVSVQNFTSYAFPTSGTHTVTLQVKDVNDCMSTLSKTIHVSTVFPQFTVNANPICLSSGTVQFINNTTNLPDPVTSYTWNFGDGSPASTATNPSHTYMGPVTPPGATYTVTLAATNTLGCIGTQTMLMMVNNPSAQMAASPGTNICVGQSVNINAPPGYPTYSLSFGDGSPDYMGGSNISVHSYTQPGGYTASITVTDGSGCQNSGIISFSVQSYPVSNFTIISPGAQFPNIACLGNNITFSSTATSTPTYPLTYAWDIGNGANIQPLPSVVGTYTSAGVYPVTLTVTTPNGCSSIITRTVGVYGAHANLNLDQTTICLGQTIIFNIKNDSTGVYAWEWDFGEGTTTSTIQANPPPSPTISLTYTNYPLPSGNATVTLAYYSELYACKYFVQQAISIVKVDASFDRNGEAIKADSVHCVGPQDLFTNTSPNSNPNWIYNWSFGDGGGSGLQNPNYTYTAAGVYSVVLTVTQTPNGCIGTAGKSMTIYPTPTVSISLRDTCANELFPLIGHAPANAVSFTWTPPLGITNTSVLATTATASASSVYSLAVTDINGCMGSSTGSLYIQQPPKNIHWDTTIIIGQIAPMSGFAGGNMSYTWTPTTDLSCQYCINPVSTTTNDVTYSVTVKDNMGCFSTVNTYSIHVDPRATVDVPTAFTPNGDGTNDVIYVDGWGIRKLNYFRIFNRWGQLLFESNDIKTGWDGTYNGVPQNMETYVYQVSAETYVDKDPQLKTGSFKLIR
jgi:gliding motility-associated-like protein